MKARIGDLLTRANLVSEAQLARALDVQNFAGGRIGTILLEQGVLGEEDLGKTLALQHGCGYVSWSILADLPPEALTVLPERFALKYFAVPYERGEGYVKMALRDPGDLRIVDDLVFVTGLKVSIAVAPEVRIYQALEKYYGKLRTPRFALLAEKLSRPHRTRSAHPADPPPAPAFFEQMQPEAEADAEARPITLAPSPDPAPFLPPEPERAPAEAPRLPRPSPFGRTPSPLAAGEAAVPDAPDAIPWEETTGSRSTPSTAASEEQVLPPAPFEDMVPFEGAELDSIEPFTGAPDEGFPGVAAATERDTIAEAVLEALGRRFTRAAIFSSRSEGVAGWVAAGDRVDPSGVRSFSASWTEPSVFLNARLSRTFYLGPLPSFPHHDRLAAALGGWPGECVVQPVFIGERPVAFLLVTAPRPGAVTADDLGYLRDLSEAASSAFENAIRLKKREI
jgi:hypothetical protein